ncbi:MAG: hypothetical protein II998_03860 [Clostridia bacterium]|nr:hypothetical protein [Clostridia bacterium]
MKKFSWLLILSLCVTMLACPVLGVQAAPGELFDATEVIYAPDFSSMTADPTDGGRITYNRNAPVIASDGSMQLTASNAGQSVWTFYLNETKGDLPTGEGVVYCLEFDIKKPNTSTAAYYRIANSGDRIMSDVYFHNDSNYVPNEFTNVKILIEQSSSKRIMILVDNKLTTMTSTGRTLLYFSICVNASSYSYYLDNYSIYKISQDDFNNAYSFFSLDESLILGANASADAITSNLNLTEGITWTSSNENIISNDGVISRDMVWPSTTVTLTAKSGDKLSKDFTFKVLRKDIAPSEGMVGDYYVYDDFETSTLESGGVVVNSGTAEIKNGKLYHTHTGTSGEQSMYYYFVPEKAAQKTIAGGNILVAEFDIKKELTEDLTRSAYYLRIQSYDGWRHYAQTNVKGSSSEPVGATGKAYYDSTVAHFKYIFDTAKNTYSLYINGMLEYYEAAKNTNSNPYNHIQSLMLVNQTPGSTVSIDNVKVYKISEKTYETGYNNYGISMLGTLTDTVDAAGKYESYISYLATGLGSAPAQDTLPVCYVAKYNGDELESVEICNAKLVTYSETDGVYGWWFPDAVVGVDEAEIGDTSIKAFVWNGVTPVDKHIVAKAINE